MRSAITAKITNGMLSFAAVCLLGMILAVPQGAYAEKREKGIREGEFPSLDERCIQSSECDERLLLMKPLIKDAFRCNSDDPADVAETGRMLGEAVESSLAGTNYRLLESYPGLGIVCVEVTGDVASVARKLASAGRVQWAEPVMYRYPSDEPDDDFFDKQWYLRNSGDDAVRAELEENGGFEQTLSSGHDIDVLRGWDVTSGDRELVVAVMDTGVDYGQRDLSSQMWVNEGEIEGDGVDNEGNGYVDDIHGWDSGCGDGDPMDDSQDAGHGTHVAGCMAASRDGGGIVGVAPNVRIMALKIAEEGGSLTTKAIVEAGDYLIAQKRRGVNVRAVNMSFGGAYLSQAEADLFLRLEEEGILVFTSAGNEAFDSDYYPANYPCNLARPNLVTVGASDGEDGRGVFSQWGKAKVDVFAPGVNILSTMSSEASEKYKHYQDGDQCWSVLNGTSMSSPLAMGVGALAMSRYGDADWRDIKSLLFESVDEEEKLEGICRTGGRLNAFSAVTGEIPTAPVLFGIDREVAVAPGEAFFVQGHNLGSSGSVALNMFGEEEFTLSAKNWVDNGFEVNLPRRLNVEDARMELAVDAGGGRTILPIMVASRGARDDVDYPVTVRQPHIPYLNRCAVIDGIAYGVGLYSYHGFPYWGIYSFDPGEGRFVLKTDDIPEDLQISYSRAVAFGGDVYFMGGSLSGRVYRYRVAENRVEAVPGVSLPDGMAFLMEPFAASDENYIYVAGGWKFTAAHKFVGDQTKVYRWDPEGGEWKSIAEVPDTKKVPIEGAAVVIDGKLVMAGGIWFVNGSDYAESRWVDTLDLSSGEWTRGELPFAGRYGTIVVADDKVFFIGSMTEDRSIIGSPFIAYADRSGMDGTWKVYGRRFDFDASLGSFQWSFAKDGQLFVLAKTTNEDYGLFAVSNPVVTSIDSEGMDKGDVLSLFEGEVGEIASRRVTVWSGREKSREVPVEFDGISSGDACYVLARNRHTGDLDCLSRSDSGKGFTRDNVLNKSVVALPVVFGDDSDYDLQPKPGFVGYDLFLVTAPSTSCLIETDTEVTGDSSGGGGCVVTPPVPASVLLIVPLMILLGRS